MLGILLLILKIIGIIILSILGLVLFLLLVILFVPIRYEADVSFISKKPAGTAGVHWLMRLLQVHFSFGKDVKRLQIKVAGVLLGGRKERKKKASGASAAKKGTKKKEDGSGQPFLPDSTVMEAQQEKDQALLEETADSSEVKDQMSDNNRTDGQQAQETVLAETVPEDIPLPASDESTDAPKEPISEKMHKIYAKICTKIDGICGKLNDLNQKRFWIGSFLEYLQTEPMNQSLGKLQANLIKILFHMLPQKAKVDLKLGFNNPATTGQLLGILAMLYPRFKGNLSVTPYFDRSILEGRISCQGRIRLITLVMVAGKTGLDKNIRTFIKKVRNGGK